MKMLILTIIAALSICLAASAQDSGPLQKLKANSDLLSSAGPALQDIKKLLPPDVSASFVLMDKAGRQFMIVCEGCPPGKDCCTM